MLQLDYQSGSRRARLKDRVNDEYRAFILQLPPSLCEYGCSLSTYLGKPSSKRLECILKLNPLIVAAPFLFWGDFPLDDETLIRITTAGCYFGAAYTILDHLSDEQLVDPGTAGELQAALYAQALQELGAHFSPSSGVWERITTLWGELEAALTAERRWQDGCTLISEENFRKIAAAKTVPLIIIVYCLAKASDRMNLFGNAERSLREVGPAVQLWHDVCDWHKDYKSRWITYFTSEVLRRLAAADGREVQDLLSEYLGERDWRLKRDFRLAIHSDNLYANYWGVAEKWFAKALAHTQQPEMETWNRFLERWIAELQEYIFSVTHPDDPHARPLTLLQMIKRIAASQTQT